MADITALKNRIRAAIKANNNQEITGPVLQQTLLDIVDELDLNPELQEAINTEKDARQSSDGQLQLAIGNEAQTRQSADNLLQTNINNVYAKIGYYTCSTEGNVAAKTIAASNYILGNGGSIKIKMANANSANNATLNINSTGAKALYYAGERASANNSWEAGETVEVYYDGTNFYANNVAGGSGSGDGAFDVSAKYPTSGVEGGNTYTFEGALAVLNANLSARKKKGGMSIKFIDSTSNKYVQYRLMATDWSTVVTDWQSMDIDAAIAETDAPLTNIIPVQHNDALIQKDYIIPTGTNKWSKIAGAKSIVYPLTGSGTIRVTPKSGVAITIYTLSEFSTPVSGESAHVNQTIVANNTYNYDASANDKYLYILLYYNSLRLPESVKIGTYDILKDLKQNIDADYKGIPDNYITPEKLSATFDETRIGILYYSSIASMAFDFTANTCTIPAGSRIFYCSKVIILATVATVLDLTHDFEGSEILSIGGGAVVYDIVNSVFKIIKHSYTTNNRNFILIATYQLSHKRVNSPSWFTVDGNALNYTTPNNSITTAMLQNGSVTDAKLSVFYSAVGILYSSSNAKDILVFDFTQNTCKIRGNTRIFAKSNYILANTNEITLDISKDYNDQTLTYGGVIVWDISSSSYKVLAHSNNVYSKNQIVIATFNKYGNVNSASSFSVDGNMYGVDIDIETMQNFSTISPCFELITLPTGPTGVTWWSDFIPITINGVDELWLFKYSSDEEHVNNDGVIYRVKMSDWTLLGSINHNFGHCNTVHYDDVHDTLLIGNLPGTQSLPSALYIFYNVSSWASESSLDFDTLSPSIVDVHDIVPATLAAFWADNSIDIRNQVYIMKAYGGGKFAKIVLGMGTNQLTYGTYDSTHAGSGQFNGTYDIVIAGVDIQYPSNDGNKNVIQGGDYAKGRVITANGHDQIYGRIWAIQENVGGEKSINSTFIECVPRKADGTIDYSVGEGLCVKDGYVYHGVIKMTDDFRHIPQTVTGYYLAKYPLPY